MYPVWMREGYLWRAPERPLAGTTSTLFWAADLRAHFQMFNPAHCRPRFGRFCRRFNPPPRNPTRAHRNSTWAPVVAADGFVTTCTLCAWDTIYYYLTYGLLFGEVGSGERESVRRPPSLCCRTTTPRLVHPCQAKPDHRNALAYLRYAQRRRRPLARPFPTPSRHRIDLGVPWRPQRACLRPGLVGFYGRGLDSTTGPRALGSLGVRALPAAPFSRKSRLRRQSAQPLPAPFSALLPSGQIPISWPPSQTIPSRLVPCRYRSSAIRG